MSEDENPFHSEVLSSDPFRLRHSDNPAMVVVSKVFDGTGFAQWRRSMLVALSVKNKIGFVDGTYPRPSSDDSNYRAWERCNDLVISWILSAVSKEIASSIIFTETASDMWNDICSSFKMQGAVGSFFLHGRTVKNAVLRHVSIAGPLLRPAIFSRFESTEPARIEEHGFESTTISDILNAKGKDADGSWLWCTTDDTVYDAVQSMTHHHVGALVVVKPGEQKSLAGIITERDYLRKIIVQGRSSKSTKVGDIMTEENKLITVSPDTKVLKAMQLMTDNRIRHIPVINEKGMIGMVSIGDVVRAVVSEHREELDRLNAFIQGGY